jgi:hypothetical protein
MAFLTTPRSFQTDPHDEGRIPLGHIGRALAKAYASEAERPLPPALREMVRRLEEALTKRR